jgi:hypothetical protein
VVPDKCRPCVLPQNNNTKTPAEWNCPHFVLFNRIQHLLEEYAVYAASSTTAVWRPLGFFTLTAWTYE